MEPAALAMALVESVTVEPVAPAIVPPFGRAGFPTVPSCKRASQETVLEAGASNEGRLRMLAAFDRDVSAASSRAAGCALWNTWCTFHAVRFNSDAPAIPLDDVKIRRISACFKEEAYKGYKMYLSKAKEHHVLAGFDWPPLLELPGNRYPLTSTRPWMCLGRLVLFSCRMAHLWDGPTSSS